MEQPTAEEQPGSSEDTQVSKEACYEEASHPRHVLNLLGKDSKYCNITLEAGGEQIKVHENVFGTYSDFFDKAFTVEMKEKYAKGVKLENISAGVLKSIVDFLYTGKISISLENAFELLAAADYLMIDKIKQFCETFLTENINASNWHDMWQNAEKYKLSELTKSTAIYIGRNFKALVDENGLDVFSATDLKLITKKSKTLRKSEEETFEVIVAWVKKDRERRISLLDGLFCNLDLCQFTSEMLKKVVLTEELVQNSALMMLSVAEELSARNNKLTEEKHQLQLQLNSKVAPDYLLAVDNDYNVHMFDVSEQVWTKLGSCYSRIGDESSDCFSYVGHVGTMHVFERKMNNGMKVVSSVPADGLPKKRAYDEPCFGSTSDRNTDVNYILADMEGTVYTVETGINAKRVYGYAKTTNQWIKLNTGKKVPRKAGLRYPQIVSIVQMSQRLQSNLQA